VVKITFICTLELFFPKDGGAVYALVIMCLFFSGLVKQVCNFTIKQTKMDKITCNISVLSDFINFNFLNMTWQCMVNLDTYLKKIEMFLTPNKNTFVIK
jgi:hypothetical protein